MPQVRFKFRLVLIFLVPDAELSLVHGMQQSDKIKYSQILITYLMLDSPDSG